VEKPRAYHQLNLASLHYSVHHNRRLSVKC